VIGEMNPKLKRLHKMVDAILENIVNDHREKRMKIEPSSDGETKDDLVDVLLNIQKSGDFGAPLTDNNIKAVILASEHLSIRKIIHPSFFFLHFYILRACFGLKEYRLMKVSEVSFPSFRTFSVAGVRLHPQRWNGLCQKW
jgi:hypothetical protein